MTGSNFYKYLMDYVYNNSAEVSTNPCGGENGCTHPRGNCPSGQGNSQCYFKGSCCFNEIYYPEGRVKARCKYDCKKLVNQYVYRSLDRYASEIFYSLGQFESTIRTYPDFNVLSLGCGPATELVAVEHFNNVNSLNKQINYYGVDVEKT